MRHDLSLRGALLIGAALLVLAPASAQAQFGGLRKKLERQVERAVIGEPSAAEPTAPAFTDRVLEITDARLGQMLAGLRAEAAQAERDAKAQAESDAAHARTQARIDAYGRCAEPFGEAQLRDAAASMALAIAAQREQNTKGAVSPTVRDSLAAVMKRLDAADSTLKATCGEAPDTSPFAAMEDDAPSAETVGAKAAGLGEQQYAVMRERLAAYVQGQRRGARMGRYVFTPEERTALERRMAELAAFAELLAG